MQEKPKGMELYDIIVKVSEEGNGIIEIGKSIVNLKIEQEHNEYIQIQEDYIKNITKITDEFLERTRKMVGWE